MNLPDLDDRPLPTGWIRQQSKTRKDKYYYFNTATRASSWKHPLDIVSSQGELSVQSKGSTSKRGSESDGPAAKKKKSKSSEKRKMPNPGHSSTSKDSQPQKNANQINKMPHVTTGVVNANGQNQACSNSKVHRISAWVNSVDTSYAPSEQGSCVSANIAGSHAGSDELNLSFEDFPTKGPYFRPAHEQSTTERALTQQSNRKRVRNDKCGSNQRIHSGWSSQHNKKDSISGNVSIPVNNNVSKNSKQTSKAPSASSTVHTPFSPLSHHPTVLGRNSDKTDTGQKLLSPSASLNCASDGVPTLTHSWYKPTVSDLSAYQAQVEEDMQLDSQGSFNSFVNDNYVARHEKAELADSTDMAMEIDNYEELEDQIKLELQGMRSEFVLDPLKVTGEAEKPSSNSYKDTLYVVLDTNVLLSHLKLISELKDFPIEGVARPVLVIPWIVIQELDSLKSDSWRIKRGKLVSTATKKNGKFGVDTLARQAVRFLHLCFESNHPRVRGQTVSEAREMMDNCSIEDPNNDDKILQCCLLFQRKAQNGHSVLFSNDQNLCSKAIINGVKAFNHQSLVVGLKELFQSSAVVLKQDHFKDYYKELKLQETLAERRAKADDLACELQCIMREGLAVVVETEMRAAYDDLWDKIVFIKPPWTLADLLQLLDKHWIAVFGQVFKRNTKTTVEDLRKQISKGGGSPGCLVNASTLLGLAHTLFDAIAARSSYNGAITKCVTAIIVLERKCNEYQNDAAARSQSPVVMGPPPRHVRALHGPGNGNSSRSSSNETEQENSSGKFEEGSEESSSVHEINTAQADSNPHALVLTTFETIWNAVNQFSAQIFSGVGFPHPVPLNLLEDLAKPTREEAIQFLGRLCSCLAFVVTAIQSVLQEPKGSETGNYQLFETLLQAITHFYEQVSATPLDLLYNNIFFFIRFPLFKPLTVG
ncbi:uncharacterized protein LOC144635377 isoform X2 [Oculina patagonica]